ERGISTKLVQEEIGKLLGKTQDEVRKLQEQGKVDAETALLGIERAVNRKLGQSQLGETGKKFAQQTLEGIAGRFKANWDNLWIGLGQRTDNRMTEAANKLLGKFENWVVSGEAARFMDDTALAIGRVADGIETATDLIDPFSKGLKRGSDSADGIATFLDGVANKKEDFKDLSNDAEKFGRALGFAWEAGGSLLSLGGRITAELTEPFTGLADSFLNSWERIGNMINGDTWGWESKVENIGRELIRGIGRGMFDATMVFLMPTAWPTVRDQLLGAVDSMREGMFNRGGDLMKGLGEGILRGVGFPVDAVKSAAQGIIGAAKETLGIRSPSRVFAGIGYQTQAGFALGVQRSSRLSVGAATVAGSRVSAGFAMGLGRPDVRSPTLEGKPPAAFGVRSALRPVEMPSALPMGMGSGGLHLHGPLVHVEASGTVDEGALIEAAEAKLEPMLESILARWSGELGAG
ncbi:MAG: hypothetical protein R3337_00005, partial [Gammaproteobacteria bacterium]|nr:hypothetical protein [Gammaproteobacteria bacterium]